MLENIKTLYGEIKSCENETKEIDCNLAYYLSENVLFNIVPSEERKSILQQKINAYRASIVVLTQSLTSMEKSSLEEWLNPPVQEMPTAPTVE